MTRDVLDLGSWCILRMAGASTLRVADSLASAGLDVWTPREQSSLRAGPQRSRKRALVPAMPTYAFARAVHLPALVAESHKLVSAHPDFSVFRRHDHFPLIADVDLEPLRIAERRGQPIEKAARYSKGDVVRCAQAGFEGLPGIVEITRGKFALVCFHGFGIPVKVETALLSPQAQTKAA